VTRWLAGMGLFAIGAVGLGLTVLDWTAAMECASSGLLVLCASPLPAALFGLWFFLGVLGAFVVARR
jgi:hypothetical protein